MPEVEICEVEGSEEGLSGLLSNATWSDLVPLSLASSLDPVVDISMDEETALLMGRFWAAKSAGELSERVLALTEHIILHVNNAHYTVWEWRWRCVVALRVGLEGGAAALPAAALRAEQELMASVAASTPKNYQLWNARRRVALAVGARGLDAELAFTGACLALDAKNYHAWAHRQALVAAAWSAEVGEAELEATRQLLGEDVRNNSAWAYRMFLVRRMAADWLGLAHAEHAAGGGTLGATLPPDHPLLVREVDMVRHAVRDTPSNQSAWAYLLGLRPLVTPGLLDGAIAELARQVAEDAPWCLHAPRVLRRLGAEP